MTTDPEVAVLQKLLPDTVVYRCTKCHTVNLNIMECPCGWWTCTKSMQGLPCDVCDDHNADLRYPANTTAPGNTPAYIPPTGIDTP